MNYIEVYRQYDIVVKSVSPDWLDLHPGFITYQLGDLDKLINIFMP